MQVLMSTEDFHISLWFCVPSIEKRYVCSVERLERTVRQALEGRERNFKTCSFLFRDSCTMCPLSIGLSLGPLLCLVL